LFLPQREICVVTSTYGAFPLARRKRGWHYSPAQGTEKNYGSEVMATVKKSAAKGAAEKPSVEMLMGFYKEMLLIRRFEERAGQQPEFTVQGR
jgi:hypothetical protein